MPSDGERQGPQGSVLRACSDVVARRLEDEIVLVQLQTNRIYTLNATAARFWELLQDGLAREEIVSRLRQEFDVDEAQLEEEITELVNRLTAQRLVLDEPV